MNKKFLSFFVFTLLVIVTLSFKAHAQTVYINDTFTYPIQPASPKLFSLGTNLTILDNINHTFEGRVTTNFFRYDIQYVAGNGTGFLLGLRFKGQTTNADLIQNVSCTNGEVNNIFTGSSSSTEFDNFHNFTIYFDSSTNTAKIFIDWQLIASTTICQDFNNINGINFTSGQSGEVKNNLVLANNLPSQFTGNLPNITLPEDTSAYFDISGNFSDANGDILTYGLKEQVENVSIAISSASGTVNLTPTNNFNGIRYAIFLANDSQNITYSNNVTINITPVNDIPGISGVMVNNSDFLNRKNGSLLTGWSFADIDNDAQAGNETLWYLNGTEDSSLRNLTLINSTRLNKTQSWVFSIRGFDGAAFSNFTNSSPLLILNAAPEHSNPSITSNDNQNRKNGTLSCNNQSTNDLDLDAVTNFLKWFRNGDIINSAANSVTLNPGNYSKNDNLTCEATPSDGQENGTSFNSTIFTIQNAAPLLNSPIQNKSWNENTAESINLSLSFADIDGDILAFNFTNVSGISISVNNSTGIATLNPATDFNGIRNTTFFAFDGTNMTASNILILTVNDVPAASAPSESPSSSSSGSGGGGGSPGGKYVCSLNWQCDSWPACDNGKQERKCTLIQVPVFLLDKKCPQFTIPEQSRSCGIGNKESCSDGIKNQDEESIDCGGACRQCFIPENIPAKNESQSSPNQITGAVTGGNNLDINMAWLAAALILIAVLSLGYFKFGHKKLFRRNLLTEEEMKKLNEMLDYKMFKK